MYTWAKLYGTVIPRSIELLRPEFNEDVNVIVKSLPFPTFNGSGKSTLMMTSFSLSLSDDASIRITVATRVG